MGGVEGGAEAASIVVHELPSMFRRTWRRFRTFEKTACQALLQEDIHTVNDLVYRQGQALQLSGMGSTLVTLYLKDRLGFVAHQGDSRAYRWRQGQLELLTRDHVSGPDSHVLTRAMGSADYEPADVDLLALESNDRFLLCSDGLTGMLSDTKIASIIHASADQRVGQNLVDAANEAGGEDNVSVIWIHGLST